MDDDTVSSTPSSRAPPTPLRRSKSRLTPQPRGRASPAPSMGHNENSPPQGKADQTALLEYAAKINEAGTSPATQSKLAATMGSPPKGRGSLLAVSPRPSVVNTPLPPSTDPTPRANASEVGEDESMKSPPTKTPRTARSNLSNYTEPMGEDSDDEYGDDDFEEG